MLSIFDNGPSSLCPAVFNLAEYVLSRAPELREKTALSVVSPESESPISYGTLLDRVSRKAGGLRELGLREGDRVLLRLGNTVEFPLSFLACIWAGLVPVPTSTQLTVREITGIRDTIAPRLIISGDGVTLPEPVDCPVLDGAGLNALASHVPTEPVQASPDQLAYIVFTSGTSGRPQAVMHAHRAIWARRMMHDGWYGMRPGDRVMHAGAFNWTYTLGTGLLDPWTIGATALIPSSATAVSQLPAMMARYSATLFAATPGVYRQALREDFAPMPHLRHGLSAGETLPEPTRALWTKTTGTPVFEAFGMSECSTFVSGAPTRPAPPGACGYPQNGRRVAILDDAEEVQDIGTPGVLSIGSGDPGLFLGYLDAPEATRARFTTDGTWFRTGDLAAMAADGAITYLGRDDDMMNAGGYRVSPLEVETILALHPAIDEAACAEVSVGTATTVIAAFYSAAADVNPSDLAAFASQRLARYKCPKIYVREDALPRSANGKLSRKALRRHYEANHDHS